LAHHFLTGKYGSRFKVWKNPFPCFGFPQGFEYLTRKYDQTVKEGLYGS
jgi:hypothetical protein